MAEEGKREHKEKDKNRNEKVISFREMKEWEKVGEKE